MIDTKGKMAVWNGQLYPSFEAAYTARQISEGNTFKTTISIVDQNKIIPLTLKEDFSECILPE